MDLLKSQLPAELAAVTAKYAAADAAATRSVPLSMPVVRFGKPDGIGFTLPALFVWMPRSRMKHFGTSNQDHGNEELLLTLYFELHLASDSSEGVERQLSRFAEALNSILYRSQDLGGPAYAVAPTDIERGKEEQPNTRILVLTASVSIESEY